MGGGISQRLLLLSLQFAVHLALRDPTFFCQALEGCFVVDLFLGHDLFQAFPHADANGRSQGLRLGLTDQQRDLASDRFTST